MRILGLFFVLFVFGCTKEKTNDKNELNIALTSNISTLDPAISYDTVSAHVVYQIYESLYEYDYLVRPYQLKPLLAEDFPQIEENGLKYTIQIKKGIHYHPSEAFKGIHPTITAQDFINQLKRLALVSTKSNGWWLFKEKIVGLDKFRKNAKSDLSNFFDYKVEGLQAPNEYTLVIKLKKPFPQLVHALAMAFTTPIHRDVLSFYKNNLNLNAVGTGPYLLKSWKQNNSLVLLKNTQYHKQVYPNRGDSFAHKNKLLNDSEKVIPFIDKVTFHIMKEAQTRWLNFLKQNIDYIVLSKDHFPLALSPSGALKEEIKKKDITLQVTPTLTYWWIAFNMTDPIVGKNLKLRKAIAHAIDFKKYITNFTNNIGLEANSIYPPGIIGYSPSHKLPYKTDKAYAKKLLAEAGFPNGKGLPVINYDVRSASTIARQTGEFIQKELGEIGIKVNIIINSFTGFLNKARTGQLQMWQGGWAMDYPDPENIIQLLISKNHPPGPNATYYSHPEVDQVYQRLSLVTEPDQVIKLTRKVEKQVNSDLPWIMLYYSRNYILYHSKIQNLRQSDLINNYIKYLRIK